MFHTFTMLPLATALYLLLSLNAVSLTAEDLSEMRQTADAASPQRISSASIHPEPGLPPDNLPDPAFLTSGEIDPIHPLVHQGIPWHSVPSEYTDGHAAIGEYDDAHDSAEGISLSDNSDLMPPERSVQEGTSSREEQEEEDEEEEEEEEDGLKGIGAGQRETESTKGPTPRGGLEEASGRGASQHAAQAEEDDPPARPNGSTVDRGSLGSVSRPGSGTTHASALDLAPPTQDSGRVDLSVTDQDGAQESQKTEPTTNEDGLTGCPLDRGNNSMQQKVEGKIIK